ncbi:hypothetical protein SLA2020_364770 [Shorea laevis]
MEKSKSFSGYNYSTPYTEIRSAFELDRSKSFSFNGAPGGNRDALGTSGNPELKRRKRVASYNMYAMEGKLKSSFRNSFKWIKSKFTDNFEDDDE